MLLAHQHWVLQGLHPLEECLDAGLGLKWSWAGSVPLCLSQLSLSAECHQHDLQRLLLVPSLGPKANKISRFPLWRPWPEAQAFVCCGVVGAAKQIDVKSHQTARHTADMGSPVHAARPLQPLAAPTRYGSTGPWPGPTEPG